MVNSEKSRTPMRSGFLVGESGFEPLKLNSDRFTVCSLWPLENSPIKLELVNGLEPLTC